MKRTARNLLVIMAACVGLAACVVVPGCGDAGRSVPELVWGAKGVRDGELTRPRAIAIDGRDRVYVVDYVAHVQRFSVDGKFDGAAWQTPDYSNGRPSGLGIDRDGNLLVCDSHYHAVRVYTPDGAELRVLGGQAGASPGQFGYVSDCVQDADGFYYLSEFSQNERVTKLDAQGNFVQCWGSAGSAPGQFNRIRGLALGPDGLLYAADSNNHRVQAFTRGGVLAKCWGESGSGPGQMLYPNGLAFGPGGELYVAERGNHRVQKFTADGGSLGTWGGPGRGPGQLYEPWGLAVDSRGRVHVVDAMNHRVQRLRF